ncbi:MAG: hypothetical protein LC124_01140 [Ignavibacteriales bacterium]|nr:hypothetical protein [Ignavibacteriales bacterium]
MQRIILRDEISLEDIAIDSITSLFERDQTGCFKNIVGLFNSWQPPIKSEEDALYFLNKLVQKRVEQYISFLLRESDPFFSKLMDSVNYLIKKHRPSEPDKSSFKKINYFGTVFIVASDTENISGKTIPIEEFEKLPAELFIGKNNLLHNIFQYLNSETSYVSAIPFNALIHKLKELNTALYNISESTTEQNDNIEINSIVAQALNKTIQKLDDTYISKEKLSMDEGEKFRKALMDISRDIKDGGVNPGLYKYLLAHIQALDEETYKQKYHNILEYLLKVLKQNIADELVQ